MLKLLFRRLAGLAMLLTTLAGCSPLFTSPPGFVEIKGEHYDYRVTSADGLVIGARQLDHDPKGDVDFWTQTTINELKAEKGYALLGQDPFKTQSGLVGQRLTFGHDEGKTPHLYLVYLFTNAGSLLVVEAGGTKLLVEKNQLVLDRAVRTLNAAP